MTRKPGSVADLATGAPAIPTPALAGQAAKEAIDAGRTTYVPYFGLPELREAVAEKLARDSGVSYRIEEVFVGSGAKSVLFCLLKATLEPGDEVIIPKPHYAAYPRLVRLAGGTPVLVDTGTDHKITPELLTSALTDRSRLLVLNSPANPTGVVYSAAEQADLVTALFTRSRTMLIADEVYEAFVFDGHRHVSPVSLGDEVKDRCVLVNSVSKTYGMTGWRVGYAAGPEAVIARAAAVHRDITNCASSVSQLAALGALKTPPRDVEKMVSKQAEKRDWAAKYLRRHTFLRPNRPAGGIYLFPDVSAAFGCRPDGWPSITTCEQLVRYLREEHGVLVAAGESFGCANRVRINFAVEEDVLREGLNRLSAATAALGIRAGEGGDYGFQVLR